MKLLMVLILISVLMTGPAFSMGKPPEKGSQTEKEILEAVTEATTYSEPSTKDVIEDLVIDTALKDRTILLIIASKDFRDEEYLIPRRIFEKYGAKVAVASSKQEKSVGVNGTEVMPDIALKDVQVKNYSAFVFVGGPGATEYYNDKTAHTIAAWGFGSRKPVAAICIAPVILANSGILGGKKATVLNGEADKLRDEGALYTGADVEVFDNIVTANGPDASEKFALAVVDLLKK